MTMFRSASACALLLLCALAAPLHGQERIPFFVQGYATGALFGRFLEEQVLVGQDIQERELTAASTIGGGAAVGLAGRQGMLQLSGTLLATDLELRDDTGNDDDALDEDELADLDAWIVALEYTRHLLGPERMLSPYAVTGGLLGIWKLGDTEAGDPVFAGGEETLYRWGFSTGLGLEVRPSANARVRIEWTNSMVGNPFDGKDSFQLITDESLKLDEPDNVRVTQFKAGLAYLLGR